MTTKSWTKLSTVLSEVLSETLDKAEVESVMSSWNSKKTEVSKLMGTGGRTKRKKDPNAPKKWKTSYITFCGDQREKVKKDNPNMSATEITTRLGELWKALSEKDKKKYEEASNKDRVRYEKEMESYTPPVDDEPEEKKRGRGAKKERTGPKRPLAAYMYFCQDKRQEVKEANPEMNGAAITSELGSRWKELSNEEKAPYEAKQAADKTRYESEKVASGSTTDSAKPKVAKEAPAKDTQASKGRGKKEAAEPAKEAPAKDTQASKGRGKKEVAEPAKEAPAKDTQASKGRGKKDASESQVAPVKPTPTKDAHAGKDSKGKKTDEVKKTPGYEYFLKDQTEELESENPEWGSRKVQSEVNKLWKELSDEDREAYEMEAAAVAEEEEAGSEVELEDD
jgi:hypothetical protein